MVAPVVRSKAPQQLRITGQLQYETDPGPSSNPLDITSKAQVDAAVAAAGGGGIPMVLVTRMRSDMLSGAPSDAKEGDSFIVSGLPTGMAWTGAGFVHGNLVQYQPQPKNEGGMYAPYDTASNWVKIKDALVSGDKVMVLPDNSYLSGSFAFQSGKVATYDGMSWSFKSPVDGDQVLVSGWSVSPLHAALDFLSRYQVISNPAFPNPLWFRVANAAADWYPGDPGNFGIKTTPAGLLYHRQTTPVMCMHLKGTTTSAPMGPSAGDAWVVGAGGWGGVFNEYDVVEYDGAIWKPIASAKSLPGGIGCVEPYKFFVVDASPEPANLFFGAGMSPTNWSKQLVYFDLSANWRMVPVGQADAVGVINDKSIYSGLTFAYNGSAWVEVPKLSTGLEHTLAGIRAALGTMTYVPGAPGNWLFPPASAQDALDRIAAAVAGLLGGPIP